MKNFILKGNICFSKDLNNLELIENGYLVCENGVSKGVYKEIPAEYEDFKVIDNSGKVIIPGLVDLHVHAPQYTFRGLGMDLELLDWLETNTFPEESKYKDLEYAKKAYDIFVDDMKNTPNTRSIVFATIHREATLLLMDELEKSGMVTMVGKVNMDRNSPDYLREESAEVSAAETNAWLDNCLGKYENTTPILTPRFIPSCTDELMVKLKEIQKERNLPLQSHISENPGEIAWVQELCPDSTCYGDAYDKFGLFGGDTPTVMAHCVWPTDEEIDLMDKNGVYVAHCPQSNTNLSSGIAPIAKYLKRNMNVGLGSDVAGGGHLSIFRAMTDAIQSSKMYWRLVDEDCPSLTMENAFYLATIGGGKFFGKVGSFENGYEFDAVVLDDTNIRTVRELTLKERLERIVYFSDERNVLEKYVRGALIKK